MQSPQVGSTVRIVTPVLEFQVPLKKPRNNLLLQKQIMYKDGHVVLTENFNKISNF